MMRHNIVYYRLFKFNLGINSQRLFQLLLTDEQNTSAIVMNTLKSIFMIKRSNITKMPEKTVNLFLDEIIYKMATSELRDAGL